jgi:hypothetical protein
MRRLINTQTGEEDWDYMPTTPTPTETTEEPNELYADLRMEQCEQM